MDWHGGLEHYDKIREDGYDPGVDIHWVTNMDRLAITVRVHERISHEEEASWIRLDLATRMAKVLWR